MGMESSRLVCLGNKFLGILHKAFVYAIMFGVLVQDGTHRQSVEIIYSGARAGHNDWGVGGDNKLDAAVEAEPGQKIEQIHLALR